MSLGERPILKTYLRNGLEVRLKEIHTAPLISSWVWYRVGSRNERPGITGISHWVEHMQFKGTPTFPSGVLDRAISRDGGYWNAFTWIDWTAYFETMPAGKIDLALQLESDRMANSLFDPADVKSERTVIISERQGHENDPSFRLMEEVTAAAFRVHPYHHQVIGDVADLETMTRDDLYAHYRRHYHPGNAILAIAGDFKERAMLARVRELFGGLERGPADGPPVRPEPDQPGERRVFVEGPDETPYLEISYHVPAATDPDYYPLTVLDSVLAGASNLNPFSGGLSNKTSRLYHALVESGLAASVNASLSPTIDPYLYTLQVTVQPDQDPEAALAALDEVIARVREEALEEGEIARAIKQARALFAYTTESITNQAFWMGYSEIFADYTWFETFLERIEVVTPDQVLEVAARLLRPSNRTVGVYRPAQNARLG